MSDLSLTEQKHVRTALRYLRRRIGTWAPVAEALRVAPATMEKVVNERRAVTASLAFRVARLAGVPIDDVLEGRYLPGACPRCGYVADFADEATAVGDAPCSAPAGLKLVP